MTGPADDRPVEVSQAHEVSQAQEVAPGPRARG